MVTWPKPRPQLTEQQRAIYEDWNKQFSGFVVGEKFNRINRFGHEFAAASSAPELRTLEIGAGAGTHFPYEPEGEYTAVERSADVAALIPRRDGLSVLVADCEQPLPYEDDSFDRVVAIHVLEHLYDLPSALAEVRRLLRTGGLFSVVIPCEGGIGYSLGRRFSSKRLFEKRYGVPYDWLIRYDHCNTASEVIAELKRSFTIKRREYFPTRLPLLDVNLIIGLELALY